MAQRSARPARRGRAAAAALLALGAAWCFAPSAGAGGARTASGGGLRAKGEQLEYFDVYTKEQKVMWEEEFLQLLDGSRADQRSIGEQEKIER
ncbi:unnamed protein product, partial [Effrenium voratum]